MVHVLISVEGQTEETFVKQVLAPHLASFRVAPLPIIISTKVVKNGPNFKGGLTSYARTRQQIARLLHDSSASAVTTMYDVNGLPSDFPGYASRPAHDAYAKVRYLEAALLNDVGHHLFLPYLQLHEFEALMFAAPSEIDRQFPLTDLSADLMRIVRAFATPEEIDEGPATAPSKRLKALCPGYRKPLHGPLVAGAAGLDRMRQKCPHFGSWLSWLESLGTT